MPEGKPAGVACVNLDESFNCKIWNSADYPHVCQAFKPAAEHCGEDRHEAITILTWIEQETAPDI